jgi:hypothetical protein
MARPIQHPKEAIWFYRFVSICYGKVINPFFGTMLMWVKAIVKRVED